MANHKSAKKRILTSEKKRVNNKWKTSRLRTEIKKFTSLIDNKDKDGAKGQFVVVQTLLAKLAKTSALRKETASRKTSRLAAQVSKL